MRISVVMIGVTDMQRAVQFYQRALELPPKSQSAEYSEFATSGTTLALEKRDAACTYGSSFTVQTEDLAGRHQFLKDHDVDVVQPPREEPYGWVLKARDSEGNIFEMVQYKSNSR